MKGYRQAAPFQPAGATAFRIAATASLYFSNSGDTATTTGGGDDGDEGELGGGGAPFLPRILRSAQSIT
jgi:hypothetical protein